jgi:hypothetical protein
MWTSFQALRKKHGKDIKFISVTTPAPGDVIGLYNTLSKQLYVGVIQQVDDNAVKLGKGRWVRTDRPNFQVNYHRILKPNEITT